jgi:hypothetical protein
MACAVQTFALHAVSAALKAVCGTLFCTPLDTLGSHFSFSVPNPLCPCCQPDPGCAVFPIEASRSRAYSVLCCAVCRWLAGAGRRCSRSLPGGSRAAGPGIEAATRGCDRGAGGGRRPFEVRRHAARRQTLAARRAGPRVRRRRGGRWKNRHVALRRKLTVPRKLGHICWTMEASSAFLRFPVEQGAYEICIHTHPLVEFLLRIWVAVPLKAMPSRLTDPLLLVLSKSHGCLSLHLSNSLSAKYYVVFVSVRLVCPSDFKS